jgi:hypothetical protein
MSSARREAVQRPHLIGCEAAGRHVFLEDRLHAPEQRVAALLVAADDVLGLVGHRYRQGLAGAQQHPHDVQPQAGRAAQPGVGHAFVEEAPELVGDLLRQPGSASARPPR